MRLAGDYGRRIQSEPVNVLLGSRGALICRVESNDPQHHADAALIAAAPRLASEVEHLAAEVERLRTALGLAQQVGDAYRGDWSGFDGRTLRSQMDELSAVASGREDATRYRAMNHLCPHGRGHFIDYCGDYDCAARVEDKEGNQP
jgi:hypothetical protein